MLLGFFSERWFGKDWREVYLVLHEDSTLTWYSERGESSPEGGILLKDAPEMIAAGQVRTYYIFCIHLEILAHYTYKSHNKSGAFIRTYAH